MRVSNHNVLLMLLLLLIMSITAHAQTSYNGQVINKTTELTIPGVNISLSKAHQATQTSEQGYFSLTVDKSNASDTLVFTSIGYKTLKLPVQGTQNQLLIVLEPSITKLNQVDIEGKHSDDEVLGKFLWSDAKEVDARTYHHPTYPLSAEQSFAKLFEAPHSNAKLMAIKFARRSINSSSATQPPFATESKYTRFFLHLCDVDSLGKPGKAFLTKEIVLLDNALLINLDLSKEQIIIPGDKFFITVDWIRIPYNEIIVRGTRSVTERTKLTGRTYERDVANYSIYYQPFLVGYPTADPKAVKFIKDGDNWEPFYDKNFEIALSATIRY